MYFKELRLENFRNYEAQNLSFSKSCNILYGENGLGKTNVLESLYILSMTKSFRNVLDKELVRWGSEGYFISARLSDGQENEHNVSVGFYDGKKQIKYNGLVLKRFSDMVGKIRIVSFLQEDINLLLGSPSMRRRYLDTSLSLSFPKYFQELRTYNNILKQRNNALKQIIKGQLGREVLYVWNEKLVETGSIIFKMRYDFFKPINAIIKELYNQLEFNLTKFNLVYNSSLKFINIAVGTEDISQKDIGFDEQQINNVFRKLLETNEERELAYGQSLFGPHKDDFLIQADGINFKDFGSQGQNRACVLTLKLAMTYYIDDVVGEESVLLLDDVLLDLDEVRKNNFFKLLGQRQVFFTSTSLYGFSKIEDSAKLFKVPFT